MKVKKIKLSLCLTNLALRYKDVWGSGFIDPRFLDVGSELEMSCQLHTPASLPPEKEPTVLNGGEWSASRTGRFTPG
jgi:hypothetical protein